MAYRMRVCFAGDGDLDASDRGISPCILQGYTAADERRHQSFVIEEEGYSPTLCHEVNAPGHEITRASLVQPCRKTPDEAEPFRHIQHKIAQWIGGVASVGVLAADHHLLDIVRSVEFDPERRQNLRGFVPGYGLVREVAFQIWPEELVNAAYAVGVDTVFPDSKYVGKPERLDSLPECACGLSRNSVAYFGD